MTCKVAGGCGAAIQLEGPNETVKNGNIVSGTGNWATGVYCYDDIGAVYINGTVQNLYIENPTSSGIDGGDQIQQNVIKNTPKCWDAKKALPSNALVQQNYCNALTVGFSVVGASSGAPDIQRNFVRATNVSGTGIEVTSGNAALTHNISDAATSIDTTGAGTVTLTENICPDAGDCPDPTVRGFSLNLDFN